MAEVKAQYSAILLGATGNMGGRIVQLLIRNPLCKKVVVVTRRKTNAFADSKVSEVVVNMDRLEEEVTPHAQGVDVALDCTLPPSFSVTPTRRASLATCPVDQDCR